MKTSHTEYVKRFLSREDGASLVEYSVALIVVTIVGGVIFAMGDSIAGVISASAGAF